LYVFFLNLDRLIWTLNLLVLQKSEVIKYVLSQSFRHNINMKKKLIQWKQENSRYAPHNI
jgi:spore coat protein CotF